jgi:hypothetical protein
MGLLRGVRAGDSGAPTINAKNIDGEPPGPHGEIQSPSDIRKMCCDLHKHDRQKAILLIGHILPALSYVMADDP